MTPEEKAREEIDAMRIESGRFDFVHANSPFNVNAMDAAMRVSARRDPEGKSQDLPERQDDARSKDSVGPSRNFPFGLPRFGNMHCCEHLEQLAPLADD